MTPPPPPRRRPRRGTRAHPGGAHARAPRRGRRQPAGATGAPAGAGPRPHARSSRRSLKSRCWVLCIPNRGALRQGAQTHPGLAADRPQIEPGSTPDRPSVLFSGDRIPWHHRLFLERISQARWVVATPTLDSVVPAFPRIGQERPKLSDHSWPILVQLWSKSSAGL